MTVPGGFWISFGIWCALGLIIVSTVVILSLRERRLQRSSADRA